MKNGVCIALESGREELENTEQSVRRPYCNTHSSKDFWIASVEYMEL